MVGAEVPRSGVRQTMLAGERVDGHDIGKARARHVEEPSVVGREHVVHELVVALTDHVADESEEESAARGWSSPPPCAPRSRARCRSASPPRMCSGRRRRPCRPSCCPRPPRRAPSSGRWWAGVAQIRRRAHGVVFGGEPQKRHDQRREEDQRRGGELARSDPAGSFGGHRRGVHGRWLSCCRCSLPTYGMPDVGDPAADAPVVSANPLPGRPKESTKWKVFEESKRRVMNSFSSGS